MSSAVETFVVQLGRAAKRGGRYLRGLSRADRDDAIAEALLAAWESRATYDALTPLEDWFSVHLKTAAWRLHKQQQRYARRHVSVDQMDSIDRLISLAAADDVERQVSTEQIAERMIAEFTEQERAIALLRRDGTPLDGIAIALRVSRTAAWRMVKAVNKKLNRLQKLLPSFSFSSLSRATPAATFERNESAPIDHEIEKLLRRGVTTTSDCPVCWRCCYFDGLTPSQYHPTTLDDPEVSQAVQNNEARKIQIANEHSEHGN